MTGYVFMSYSRKDEQTMRAIAKFLRREGIKVWVDNEKLIPGTPVWEVEVEKGIRNASAIVVILSPDSKDSEWVRREIGLADQHQKRVFPVLVRGDENASITLRLINRQFVDLRQNSASGLKSLSEAVSFYISELFARENIVLKDAKQLTPTPTAPQKVEEPHREIRQESRTAKKSEQNMPARRTSPSVDVPARNNVFGWLKRGARGDAKRLLAQLADKTKRDHAAQELIRLDGDALPVLLEALQTRDSNLLPLYQQILARIPSATPALIKTLQEAHPIMRARVADVLGTRKDKTAVPALLDALNGEYYTVRARAAIALGRMGTAQAIEPLLITLKDQEDDVRIAACLALGFFKDPSTFDDLANILLDDPKIEVRQAAAKAFGHTQHLEALPYLMEALRDSYWWYEREQAASDLFTAIEQMGTMAVEPLMEALHDKEGAVRRFAASLLGRLGDPRAIEPLGMALYDMHHDVGKASAEALVNFGASSFDILVEALSHPEMWIRIHSIQALVKIKDLRVASVLLDTLNDPEREVKKHVIEALGELKDPKVKPALQEIASDRSDRELHALAKAMLEKIN